MQSLNDDSTHRAKRDGFGEGTSGRTLANLTARLKQKWATANSGWLAASLELPLLTAARLRACGRGPTKTRGVKKVPHSPPSAGAVAMGWFCFQMLCPPKHNHPDETSFPKWWLRKYAQSQQNWFRKLTEGPLLLSDFQLTPAVTTSFSFPGSLAASTFVNFFCFQLFFHDTGSDSLNGWGSPMNLTSTSHSHALFLESGLGLGLVLIISRSNAVTVSGLSLKKARSLLLYTLGTSELPWIWSSYPAGEATWRRGYLRTTCRWRGPAISLTTRDNQQDKERNSSAGPSPDWKTVGKSKLLF